MKLFVKNGAEYKICGSLKDFKVNTSIDSVESENELNCTIEHFQFDNKEYFIKKFEIDDISFCSLSDLSLPCMLAYVEALLPVDVLLLPPFKDKCQAYDYLQCWLDSLMPNIIIAKLAKTNKRNKQLFLRTFKNNEVFFPAESQLVINKSDFIRNSRTKAFIFKNSP